MSSLNRLLYTARDALSAQSYGLGVTGQNIANASTPLYARRSAVLQTRPLGDAGTVEVKGLTQAIDRYADSRLFASTGLNAGASERDTQLASVEALFNDAAGSGLSDALSALFGSFETLSANPADKTVRSEVLSRADAFATRAREIGDALATQKAELLGQAQSVVKEINAKANDVAHLSRQITAAQALGQDTSDLVDRRNLTLLELSGLIDLRTVTSSAGDLLVQASGTTLVEGGEARQLEVDLAAGGSLRLLARRGDGGATTEVTQFLTGGKLAGIREARDQDIFELARRFDEFIFDVATTVNAQHASGVGLDRTGLRDLFDVSPSSDGAARSLRLSPDVAGHPERVAAASSLAELPGGSGNAVLLAALGSAPIPPAGTRTAAQAYSDIVGDIGLRKASAATDAEFRDAIRVQAETFRESTSGVSLDEEMVALSQYQRAYQAASKVLTVVDELLGELIGRVGS